MVTENPDRMVDLDGFCHHIIIYRGKNKKNSQASKREMQLILFGTRKLGQLTAGFVGFQQSLDSGFHLEVCAAMVGAFVVRTSKTGVESARNGIYIYI